VDPLSLGAICSYWAVGRDCLVNASPLVLAGGLSKPIPHDCYQAISALADIINQYSNRWSDSDLCMPQYFYRFANSGQGPLLTEQNSSMSTRIFTKSRGSAVNCKAISTSRKLELYFPLPPADNVVQGPLHLLKLDLHPRTRIPKNIISYFLSLAERGVTVNVLSGSEDILQSSISTIIGARKSPCAGIGLITWT
jgi:hypothetical protein